ncbi:MAG TPA: S8 family serine peptidase [Thermoanaerobaculia bacterium]|nr:S8 family serine peptidase [Thermoanaerobaculia bacterium]
MSRIVPFAAVFLFAFTAAADPVSTRCGEREVALDGRHSVAVLEDCGDHQPGDLLWHLDRIDQVGGSLDGRFTRGGGGAGSIVYVMDTGIRADHVEFGGRVIAGIDVAGAVSIGASTCTSPGKSLQPCFATLEELASSSHGTAVASIIGGARTGVAPQASLVSVRIMNERGLTTTSEYMQAFDAIIEHAGTLPRRPRTAIVNISGWVLESLGRQQVTVTFAQVEQKMREMIGGVEGTRFLFVVAANNVEGGCGDSGVVDRFPAILGSQIDGVITVGGMTARNDWWTGSCRGGVEVLAPAQGIFSATITASDHYRGKRPNHRSGTSFAAPVIAGIAARLLADHPGLTPQELEAWITSTPSRIENPSAAFAEGRVAYLPASSIWQLSLRRLEDD